jgi:dolichol kinase
MQHELQLGHELHAFLDDVPRALKGGRFEELRQRCLKLMHTTQESRMHKALSELHHALDGQVAKAYVHTRYEEAMRAYEQWLSSWRTEEKAKKPASLSPLIAARTLFHSGMALTAVICYHFFLTRTGAMTVLLTLGAIFGTLELTRRFSTRWNEILVRRVFGLISRPRELHKTNSATWYLGALCLITPVFSREAVVVAILVLGFGDPAAAWIGKRFGRFKLYRNKSLVGSLAFFTTSMAVAGGFLLAFANDVPLSTRMVGVFLGALAGTIAELYTVKLDDNLVVPIAAALAASIVL